MISSKQPTVSLTNNAAELKALFGDARFEIHKADRIALSASDGEGFLEFVETSPKFNMIISDCRWGRDRMIRYRGEGWIRLNCCLDATAVMEFEKIARHELVGAECRVFHQPEGVDCSHSIRGSAQSLCVTISTKRDYLVEDLGLEPDELANPVGEFLSGAHDGFFFERFPMTASMTRTVMDMVQSQLHGSLRTLHLAAKAHELVCQAWDSALRNDGVDVIPLRFTEDHRRRVEQARELLDQSLSSTPAAAVLARKVGLNRNQLAYGFRKLYRMSVYDYHLAQRLEAAWTMLAAGDRSIADIAFEIGYQHQASFATAFRARFGVSPKAVSRGARSPSSLRRR